MSKTTLSKVTKNTDRAWYIVDAEGCNLGKLAVKVANILRGKNKKDFTPHLDCGDYVIIINAAKVAVTGKKMTDKIYYRHTNYPGGIKAETFGYLVNTSKRPCDPVQKAIQGMITRGPLGYAVLNKLKIYADANHGHDAQSPIVLDNSEFKR